MSTKHFNPPWVGVKEAHSNRDGHWQFQNAHFTDSNYQVAVIEPEDHEAMIRLFFALKVWIRYDDFSLPE
jgi:hypothetical protein